MLHILMVLVLLWSAGLQVEDNDPPEPADIRLVGGATRCAGGLQMNLHNDWKPVDDFLFGWNLRTADVVCRALNCGSALSAKIKNSYIARHVWKIKASHVQSGSALKYYEPVKPQYSSTALEIICSESVRLVNGTTLCSGRVELKAEQSWSSVCEGDFDWQDAEVVCRELGCGAPLKLQKERYENMSALELTKEFQCRGNESTLLDCESYESARNTCSPVRLNCSEPDNVRLVGGGSRCAGRLEMKLHDDWKPLDGLEVNLESAALVCRKLKCGLAISAVKESSVLTQAWGISSSRVQSGSVLREDISIRPWHSSTYLEISCSDLLFQPMIFITPSTDVINEFSNFTISCSIKPQYPGGSFQLIFTTSNTKHSYTKQAVNHTAYFLFPAAHHSHQGSYSCVYHIYVSSQKFSSESQPLHLSILASPIVFFARLVGLLLTLILCICAIYYTNKAAMSIQAGGQEPEGQQNAELEYYNLGASRVEGGPNEEAEDKGTDL